MDQTLVDYRGLKMGEPFFISGVTPTFDNMVFRNHVTTIRTYENIFGYNQEEFNPKIKPGSIYLEENGYFNLTNPRSLVYDTDELFAIDGCMTC